MTKPSFLSSSLLCSYLLSGLFCRDMVLQYYIDLQLWHLLGSKLSASSLLLSLRICSFHLLMMGLHLFPSFRTLELFGGAVAEHKVDITSQRFLFADCGAVPKGRARSKRTGG